MMMMIMILIIIMIIINYINMIMYHPLDTLFLIFFYS